MKRLTTSLLSLLLTGFLQAKPMDIPPDMVVVLYNSKAAVSRDLASHYAKARAIPKENVVGLPMTTAEEISREDYNKQIRDPLLKLFDSRKWWQRAKVGSGLVQPISNNKRILVTVRGVPFKIARTPDTIPANKRDKRPFAANIKGNDSSVDSELSLLGIEGYPLEGHLNNPYFRRDESVMEPKSTSFLVVGRIDGPAVALCKRLVDDAIKVEKTGLWGRAYLDLAKKGKGYELGDQWLENIARMNKLAGIPTVIDRHRDTFVTNYPMTDAAIYFGWYAHNRNGPLLNPGFSFKQGAVAVHLHSFSAFQLRHAEKRWSGPILSRGATATVGNVYEPFLALTHHFDILYQRLLQGYTIGEAAQMAIPGLSWQGVLLGDPLYRPFSPSIKINIEDREDRDYKVLRRGFLEWKDDPETMVTKLRTAANKMNSGPIFEALGLLARENGEEEQANAFFTAAGDKYHNEIDRLRQKLNIVDVYRSAGNKEAAILLLRKMEPTYAKSPEGKAVTALLNIIDPPAPPPVRLDPKKSKKRR